MLARIRVRFLIPAFLAAMALMQLALQLRAAAGPCPPLDMGC